MWPTARSLPTPVLEEFSAAGQIILQELRGCYCGWQLMCVRRDPRARQKFQSGFQCFTHVDKLDFTVYVAVIQG